MSDFDYDKIKDMRYDKERERYIGEDGSEFKVSPYSDGSGYKFDYYDRSTYGNTKHNSTHVNADLNENWSRVDNDRDNGTKTKSSGSGCYLTTACMQHMKENFDDNCVELMTLRWFRDNFVNNDDIKHYYEVAPSIVDKINTLPENQKVYLWIYEKIVAPCVNAIKQGNYEFAYSRYKNSVILLEEEFVKELPQKEFEMILKRI